jgi:hypothetical protein
MVQDPIAGAPRLRAISSHEVVEALQDCFIEFLIYCKPSRDIFIMNQPINVENAINTVLTFDFTFFGRGDDAVFHWEDICFVPGQTVNPAFVTSDYRGREFGIILGSIMEVRAN